MRQNALSAVVGFLFAIGLGISGMTDPQKVMSFLDVFGNWDASLLFVMVGAILVHFISYRIIAKRESPLYSKEWHLPKQSRITKNLVLGSILFGVGWGLAGYCPGPALTSVATFDTRPLLFVASMIVGMVIFKIVDKKAHFKR